MRTLLTVLIVLINSMLLMAQPRISLNKGWTFSQSGKAESRTATVPGSVQSDLLLQHKIENPFIALNETKIAWVAQTGWNYSRTLTVSADFLKNEHIYLVFEGLDTYAEVFLNGKSILKAGNMFRRWQINVKPWLKPGANLLEVRFASVIQTALPLATAASIKYPADNEQGDIKISPFVRKAAFQFGWDFAPRLLTTGIWKPVYLEYWNEAAITDVQTETLDFNASRANLGTTLEITAAKSGSYSLRITDVGNKRLLYKTTVHVTPGKNYIKQPVILPQPRLWSPNGVGTPYLYQLKFELGSAGKSLAAKTTTVGIRTIQVVNEPDSIGHSFYVKVNGKPVFIKGANFVPVNSLNPAENRSKLEKLFSDMKESNFNMVRIWGGGYYGSDAFYELADAYGIMVWQDFPFACTMYPSDTAFLANVKQEAVDNIKRIRNHPSLALWCGNNEIAVGWKNWGWQSTYGYSKSDSLELINGYNQLFKKLLPAVVAQYDSGRFYFHSSPISNWGKPEDFKHGDNHYWGVYHGEAPFSAYESHIPRFNSEFGFQSFPSWQTLQTITERMHPELDGAVLTVRQKSYKGNALLKKYMNWYYQPPASEEDFVYLTQLQQAEGMKIAIEASRRAMPYNMGTLMWQLNDVWPAISWSAIEFNGQWKAAQYFIKKAYAPVIVTAKEEKDSLEIGIVSDLNRDFDARLVINKWKMDAPTGQKKERSIAVYGTRVNSFKLPLTALDINDPMNTFITLELKEGDRLIASNIYYFKPVKDLNIPTIKITHQLAKVAGGYELMLQSDKLAKNVYLSIEGAADYHFSDNFFDMLPGQSYHIKLNTLQGEAFIKSKLKIRSVKNQMK